MQYQLEYEVFTYPTAGLLRDVIKMLTDHSFEAQKTVVSDVAKTVFYFSYLSYDNFWPTVYLLFTIYFGPVSLLLPFLLHQKSMEIS